MSRMIVAPEAPPRQARLLGRALGGACLGLALLAGSAAGQELAPKRSLAVDAGDACPAIDIPDSAPRASPVAVDSLLTAGSRAAILGDLVAARDVLRRASAIDPRNAVVSYRLARTLDEQGDSAGALLEYCRYLALAPTATDRAEVGERAAQLAAAADEPLRARLRAEVGAGLDAYDGGRFDDAAAAFARVIELRPSLAAAYYNRAAAHLAGGRRDEAARDLATYLAMAPEAADGVEVRSELDRLRAPIAAAAPLRARMPRAVPRAADPSAVLLRGIAVPGLGQHATGRTALGAAVLGGVAGAMFYGTREEAVVRTRGAFDPFGNYYEYEVEAVERTRLAQGFGFAAAIAVAGAVEAYFYARRQQSHAGTATAIPLVAYASADGAVGIGLSLPVGRR